jgi:hypothetical protein
MIIVYSTYSSELFLDDLKDWTEIVNFCSAYSSELFRQNRTFLQSTTREKNTTLINAQLLHGIFLHKLPNFTA